MGILHAILSRVVTISASIVSVPPSPAHSSSPRPTCPTALISSITMDTTTVEQDTPPDTSTDTPMSTTTSTFSGSSAPTSPHYSDSALVSVFKLKLIPASVNYLHPSFAPLLIPEHFSLYMARLQSRARKRLKLHCIFSLYLSLSFLLGSCHYSCMSSRQLAHFLISVH